MTRTIKMMILACCLCIPAYAQEERQDDRVQVRGIFGASAFYEADIHKTVGVMTDVRLLAGLRFGPEVVYHIGPPQDRDMTTMAVLSYDFNRSKRVTPFISAGGGMLRQNDRGRWLWRRPAYGAGGGVKIATSERLFIAPELRLGWEQ